MHHSPLWVRTQTGRGWPLFTNRRIIPVPYCDWPLRVQSRHPTCGPCTTKAGLCLFTLFEVILNWPYSIYSSPVLVALTLSVGPIQGNSDSAVTLLVYEPYSVPDFSIENAPQDVPHYLYVLLTVCRTQGSTAGRGLKIRDECRLSSFSWAPRLVPFKEAASMCSWEIGAGKLGSSCDAALRGSAARDGILQAGWCQV